MNLGAAPPAGDHGGDGPRLAAWLGVPPEDVLDLSQSLNPVVPDIGPLVAHHLDALRRYPDAGAATVALADRLGVDPARVVLTNGGAEAIALLAAHLGRGWVDEPEFSLYRRHLPRLDPDGPRFRSNPHSPSGRLAGDEEHAEVWDEAFLPLATGRWTRGDAGPEQWVLGSLTKTFACPGLRLGYLVAPDEAGAAAIASRQPQWAVGGLGLAVLPELLDGADLPAWSRRIAGLRTGLVDLLRRHGLDPQAADANWVLVEAPSLRAALAERAIAVRDCASFGLDGTVRIAVPDERGLQRLASALERSVDG